MDVEKVETGAAEGGDQSIGLREQIVNAAREVKERDAGQVEDKSTEQTADKGQKDGARTPERDTTGKFVKPEGDKTVAGETPEQQAAKQDQAGKVDAAPTSWSAAAKAKWAAIDPEIRAEIARREADVTRGFTKMDEERAFGKTLREIINPYMPIISAEGGTPDRAVRELLNTAYLLRTAPVAQKVALVRQTCQQFGIPLEQLSQPQAQVHPVIADLQRQIGELTNARQVEQTQRQHQETTLLASEIQTFAAEPGHEHFEAVKAHMAALLQSGLAQDLKDAYDQAIWARPDLRSTLLQSQQQTAEEKRVAEAKAKAEAARRAGSSVTGAPGAGGSAIPPANRSLRDELRAQLQAAQGRV